MVLFLNYLPWLLVAVCCWLAYSQAKKKVWDRFIGWLMVGLVLAVALQALSNSSYLPRGTVEPIPAPSFEESEKEVQDRLRKPERNTEESDERLKELSDWRKHKKEREEQQ